MSVLGPYGDIRPKKRHVRFSLKSGHHLSALLVDDAREANGAQTLPMSATPDVLGTNGPVLPGCCPLGGPKWRLRSAPHLFNQRVEHTSPENRTLDRQIIDLMDTGQRGAGT